jgi:predicted ATPase/DNA-binding CsgD family transcriptional regulator
MLKKVETDKRMPSQRLAARLADALALTEAERAWFFAQIHAPALPPSATHAAPPLGTITHPQPAPADPPLPIPPGPLIGRSRELRALCAALQTSAGRLVTLTGPGGVGKTYLALHVAATLSDAFVDGIWFVDLAPLRDPALVPLVLARTLGLDPGSDPQATLTHGIGMRHMLLVLDNLEHLLAVAPLLAALLASAPNLRLLATSRAPLHLAAEQRYDVAPLALPPEHQPHAFDTYGAVELFTRRAQALLPAFTLTLENGPIVAAICRRLDGLPLAIELATAWLALLPPQALLSRLDRSLALLTEGRRDLPARQQTLEAVLDWSFHLLDAPAQRLFARMSVFHGGAGLEAIAAVCWAGERSELLPVLRTLVDHSCVRQQPDRLGEPRFTMLETIREYAHMQLSAADAPVRRRHAQYYLALAEQAAPHLRRSAQRAWLDRLEVEHDNLRAACACLLEVRSPLEILQLVAALHWFWDRRGHLQEGRRLIAQALALAGDPLPAVPALRHAYAWALIGAATLAFDQGDWPAAAASAEAAFDLLQASTDHRALTLALLRLAFVRAMSDPGAAGDLLAGARDHAAASADPWYRGLAQFVSAQAALFGAHDLVAARTHMLAATPAMRAAGDPWLLAHGLTTTGSIALAEGDLTAARVALEEGYVQVQALDDPRSRALVAATTADVARCQGDYARAAELYSESLAIYHTLGNVGEIPAILHNQGYVALAQGDSAAARELFAESLRRQYARANPAGIAEGLAGLAAVTRVEGRSITAARLFGAVAALRLRHPGPVWPAERYEVERQEAALRVQLSAAQLTAHTQAGGALAVEAAIAEALVPPAQRTRSAGPTQGGLTQREYEVARLVAGGSTNRAIAATLVISERTAEHHVANILAKLNFSSRAQIAAWVASLAASAAHT